MPGRDDFLGEWHMSRQIMDRFADQRGTLSGTATLTAQGGQGLQYDEAGIFQLGQGAPMQATRRYHWIFDETGVQVRFANGDPFHSFAPDSQSQGTDHPCGPDLYRVRYDFRGWPDWTAVWDVAGPAKDYTMKTSYCRA